MWQRGKISIVKCRSPRSVTPFYLALVGRFDSLLHKTFTLLTAIEPQYVTEYRRWATHVLVKHLLDFTTTSTVTVPRVEDDVSSVWMSTSQSCQGSSRSLSGLNHRVWVVFKRCHDFWYDVEWWLVLGLTHCGSVICYVWFYYTFACNFKGTLFTWFFSWENTWGFTG